MSDPLIHLRDLEKTFPLKGGVFYALRRIGFDIHEGEFVSIMGPSGAGKTCLLHIMGLHDREWSGTYQLLGHSVSDLSRRDRQAMQREHIGFVFQQFNLIEELTVYENLEMPLLYRNIGHKDRQARVCDLLDRFQIVAKRDLLPGQLSGGHQQLVGIARALVGKPTLILADEPTGNLHSDQGREIMEHFRRVNQAGTTIVQVTHSEENAAVGDRVLRLFDGWLEEDTRQVAVATS
jgi:ABC-type lipoprotein export system ATPase subunit